jgi:ABC-2 type transport system permease protein
MNQPESSPNPSRLRLGLVRLRAVAKKELLQIRHDRRMLPLLVIAPLVQTVVFGFAVDFDIDRVPTLVVDQDHSRESRLHTQRLLADGTLVRAGYAASVSDAETALDRGEAAAALVLPANLERDMLAGRPSKVQVLLDGTDPNRSNVAAGAASGYFGEAGTAEVREQLERQGRNLGVPRLLPRVLYNPSLASAPYMIPGVMGMVLLIVTTVITAMGLTREREAGTLEQIMVTPIRPIQLLLGKMLPYLVIGLLDVGLVLTAGAYVFGVPLRGDLAVLFLVTLLYLLSTLGTGLLISTVSKTQQQSFLGGFLFMMPALLLSGVMTPIAAMPDWLAAITYVNPVRYYVETLRAILLKGATFDDVKFQVIALAALGVSITASAILRFSKRLS